MNKKMKTDDNGITWFVADGEKSEPKQSRKEAR